MEKIKALVAASWVRLSLLATFVAAAFVGAVAPAGAAPYDLSSLTSGVTDQIQGALTTVLPIAGGILALFVGWRVIRRMVKA